MVQLILQITQLPILIPNPLHQIDRCRLLTPMAIVQLRMQEGYSLVPFEGKMDLRCRLRERCTSPDEFTLIDSQFDSSTADIGQTQ